LKNVADTGSLQIEIGEVVDGNVTYTLEISRRQDMAEQWNAPFTVRKILDKSGATLLWSFAVHEQFNGHVRLAEACGKLVLAFVSRGKDGKVERVHPFTHLRIAPPPSLSMKREAAKYLGLDYVLDSRERVLEAVERVQLAQAAPAERSANNVIVDERARRRSEVQARVHARGKIKVQCLDRTRHGYPVLETEWPVLEDGTDVVRVFEIDDKTGKIGSPLEAFRVRKVPGKAAEKFGVLGVYSIIVDKPRSPKCLVPDPYEEIRGLLPKPAKPTTLPDPILVEKGPKPTRSVKVRKDGTELLVRLFASIEVVREARRHASPGNYIAVDRPAKDGRLEVFKVLSGGGSWTVGMCKIVT
jgi:hypothetical protein